MKYLRDYNKLFENDLYYKSNIELLKYIDSLKSNTFIWLDTETTGLGGPKLQQLVQIGSIASTSSGRVLDTFNEKILLDKTSKKRLKTDPLEAPPGERFTIHQALALNHYYDNPDNIVYRDEMDVLNDFFKWVSKFKNPVFLIQNAAFDMSMIAGRSKQHNLKYKVLDTMKLLMLYLIPTLEIAIRDDDDLKQKLAEFPRNKSGNLSSSLHPWGKFFSAGAKMSHDALDDVRTMMRIYYGILEYIEKYKNIDISSLQNSKIQWLKKIGR